MNHPSWRQLTLAFIPLLFTTAAAGGQAIPVSDKEACMAGPLAEFGRYIGNWKIEDSSLSRESGEWEAGAGAHWNFVCIGGAAIQDFWLPADGKVGTNLRTWNQETESWDIAWTITGMPGFACSPRGQTMERRYAFDRAGLPE